MRDSKVDLGYAVESSNCGSSKVKGRILSLIIPLTNRNLFERVSIDSITLELLRFFVANLSIQERERDRESSLYE